MTNQNSGNKQVWICVIVGIVIFIGAIVCIGINISTQRNYEKNYIRTYATVTGLRTEHVSTTDSNLSNQYRLYFTYELDGNEYKAKDRDTYTRRSLKRFDKMLGTQVEIYVDLHNPGEVKQVSSTDLLSIISVIFFACVFLFYIIGVSILLSKKSNPLKKRLLFVWLPLFILCVAFVLLCWIGLPNDGFLTVFTRVRGALGYTVLAGVCAVASMFDIFISAYRKNNPAKKLT